jgi:hypothetical protein
MADATGPIKNVKITLLTQMLLYDAAGGAINYRDIKYGGIPLS